MLECSKCGKAYPDGYHFKNDGRTTPLVCLKCSNAIRVKASEKLPFSFGAAFLPAIWSFGHSRVWLGIVFIFLNLISRPLMFLIPAPLPLPLILILWAGIAVAFGRQGSSIAFRERGYGSLEELKSGERVWEIAGIIAGIIEIVLALVALSI